ncbi:MAG: hypothetical protein H6812_01420 [Phycisphaeraceae bacterium]|nr:hypothetical protein [Phycisphaeraceae bacterium]
MADAECVNPNRVFSTPDIEIVRDQNTISARSLLSAGCFYTTIFTAACVFAFGFVSFGMTMLITLFLQPFQWSALGVIPFAGMWIAIGCTFILATMDFFYLSQRPGRYRLRFDPGVGWYIRRLVLSPKYLGRGIEVTVARRKARYDEYISWIAIHGARKKPHAFGPALRPMNKRERTSLEKWLNRQIMEIEREYSDNLESGLQS